MHHFIIGQDFRYKKVAKMAAQTVNLNEINPKYTPVVYVLRPRSQNGKLNHIQP